MSEISAVLMGWQMDLLCVRERMCRSATPREHWHALWLLELGPRLPRFAETGLLWPEARKGIGRLINLN
jgi:hypothetical protein